MTNSPSFDSAPKAIKYAHEWAEAERFSSVMNHGENSAPAAIYRKRSTGKGKRDLKAKEKRPEFAYTVVSSWIEKPEGAGHLVMVVSASGVEQLHGPWMCWSAAVSQKGI